MNHGLRGRLNGAHLALVWALASTFSGCTLLLDPDCTESDCKGGTCVNGVCDEAAPGDPDEGVDLGMGNDMGAPDEGITPDMQIPDEGIPPDMQPDMAPPTIAPTCEFDSPRMDVIVASTSLEVSVLIADADTPLDALTIRLDGADINVDATGAYTGTVELDDGDNTVTLTAEDPDGQRCEATVGAISDTTAPVVTLQTRALINTPAHQVRGDVVDAHYEGALTVTLDGEPVEAEPSFDGADFQVDVDLGGDGAREICVTATDLAGNTSDEACYTIEVDTEAPTVTITQPGRGFTTTEDSVIIVGEVTTGGAPEARSQVRVTQPANGPRTQADAQGEFDMRVDIALGENTIQVCGDDEAGNEGCASITVTREDPSPCIEIEQPVEDAVLGQAVFVVSGTVCPAVEAVSLHVGDVVSAGQVSDGRFFGQVALPNPGIHEITAEASAGDQTADDTVTVLYDATGPDLRITRPDANICTNGFDLAFGGSVSDPDSAVTSVVVIDTRNPAAPAEGQLQPGSLWAATISPVDGEDIEFEVVATNEAGLETRQSHILSLDNTGPTLSVDFEERAWLGVDGTGKVVLEGTVETEICSISSLSINNEPVVINANRFRYARQIADGEHQARILATDLAGNVTEINPGYRVDSQAPSIENFLPAPESYVAAEVELTAFLSDRTAADAPESGLGTASVNGVVSDIVLVSPDDSSQGTVSGTVAVPEGRSCFEVVAEDAVGNDTTAELCLRHDTTPPGVTITAPLDGSDVASPALVMGTFDDGEFGSGLTELTVNGVAAVIDHDNGEWIATDVPIETGAQTLTVVATDAEGNAADPAATVDVNVRSFGHRPSADDGLDATSDVSWVGVADFNGDDLPDVLSVSSVPGGGAHLALQDDTGRFSPVPDVQIALRQDVAYTQGIIGDFNGDGAADVVLTGVGDNGLFVGNGAGALTRQPQSNIPTNVSHTGLAAGDLNRDGRLDLLLFGPAGARALLGNGDGTFEPEALANLGLAGIATAFRGKIADFNGDALPDVVVGSGLASSMYFGLAGGGFVDADTDYDDAPSLLFETVDANHDGRLDLFTGGEGGNFHFGAANGPLATDDLNIVWGPEARGIVFADYDGDGLDDAVVVRSNGVDFWRGAAGDFVAEDAAALGLSGAGTSAVGADIDNDGDTDVIIGGAGGVTVLRNNRAIEADGYEWIKLDIQRTPAVGAGPADSVGVVVVHRNVVSGVTRAVTAAPFGPTLVTAPQLVNAEFTIHFTDLGAVGQNTRLLLDVLSGVTYDIFGRE